MRQVLCGGVAAALVLAPAGQALEKGKGEARKAPELKQLVGAVMPGRTRSGRRDSIRNLLTGKEVAKDTWISPDESWTCSLSGRWTVQEGEEGGAPFVALIPAGEAQPQRAMFAFPGALTPELAGQPDTALLAAGMNVLVQKYAPGFTPRAEAAAASFGTRAGAAMEYAGTPPGSDQSVSLWGGLARESGYYLLILVLAKTSDLQATQKIGERILETAKPYQAPRKPEWERALLGRWSAIVSVSSTSSSTVTYQFNPDGSFWRRFTGSYLVKSPDSTLSGASDDFDEGTFGVYGRYVVAKLKTGRELRLRVDGQLVGGQIRGLKINGRDCSPGEL